MNTISRPLDTPTPEAYPCGHMGCANRATVVWMVQTDQMSAPGFYGCCDEHPHIVEAGMCAFQHRASPNHSDDRVAVYHGEANPLILCGYHASEVWLPRVLKWRATTQMKV